MRFKPTVEEQVRDLHTSVYIRSTSSNMNKRHSVLLMNNDFTAMKLTQSIISWRFFLQQ